MKFLTWLRMVIPICGYGAALCALYDPEYRWIGLAVLLGWGFVYWYDFAYGKRG